MANHWYAPNGDPLYTVKGLNGKERDTTLRDARKFNLVPSVTTIIASAAKPGIDAYIQQQLLDACMNVGYSHNCNDKIQWKQTVISKSREHSQSAAKKGTEIHNALEQYYLGGGLDPYMSGICSPILDLIEKEFPGIQWEPEKSFASPLGFGGKIDMSHKSENRQIILDFKTKTTDDVKKMIPYEEAEMQTAAYAVGLGFTYKLRHFERYNLYISTKQPGLLNLTKSDNFIRDWGMFEALLKFWQLKNKYIPDQFDA